MRRYITMVLPPSDIAHFASRILNNGMWYAEDCDVYHKSMEKDEFTIWAGIASLLVFVLKEPEYLRPEEPKSLLILSAFYLLLIISVYYRHLSQAIYMQEAKEK